MPITEAQLAAKIRAALDFNSDDPEVDINAARNHFANELAEGIAEFTIGREVSVIGVQTGGGTATGTIQE